MVDTSRTVSDLTANLFQDGQASGSITPQDLRDLVETVQVKQGSIYVSSATTTTIASTGVYVEAAGTWTLSTSPTANEFDMNTNGRLRYTGTPTVNCMFMVTTSMQMAAGTTLKETGLQLHKNGTLITGSTIIRLSPSVNNKPGNVTTFALASMATNDYISIYVANLDSTDNIDVDNANLIGYSLVT